MMIGAPGRDRPRARNVGRLYWTWNGWSDRIRVVATGVNANERLGR